MGRSAKLSAVFAFGIGMLALSAGAKASFVVDQENTVSDSFIGPGDGQGQSFTPTQDGIDAATFSLGVGDPDAELVFATLYSGDGFGGPVIGVSDAVLVDPGSFSTYEFDFGSTISLDPGTVYTLGLNNGFGDLYAEESTGDQYTSGIEYDSAGVAQPGYDLTFSEGTHPTSVPEVPTQILSALSVVGCAAWAIRRRLAVCS